MVSSARMGEESHVHKDTFSGSVKEEIHSWCVQGSTVLTEFHRAQLSPLNSHHREGATPEKASMEEIIHVRLGDLLQLITLGNQACTPAHGGGFLMNRSCPFPGL
ncbi:uncharacterized protein ACIQIH_002983 isoform 1-T1 [Cyanocitta cristata]